MFENEIPPRQLLDQKDKSAIDKISTKHATGRGLNFIFVPDICTIGSLINYICT